MVLETQGVRFWLIPYMQRQGQGPGKEKKNMGMGLQSNQTSDGASRSMTAAA